MAEKKAKAGKTVTVRQIRSANRKPVFLAGNGISLAGNIDVSSISTSRFGRDWPTDARRPRTTGS